MKFLTTATITLALAWAPTVSAVEGQQSLDSIAWMTGSWQGEGIDGAPVVEVYSPPAGGQMIGHFRQTKPDGSVMFYELITLSVRDGKLHYRVKHFNADLTGWEEKSETQEFIMESTGGGRWESPGVVIERQATDSMRMTVRIDEGGGRVETSVFNFTRQ